MTSDSETGMKQEEGGTYCFVCKTPVDVQDDEWWQHNWQENPSSENVEKALEDRGFRDWFIENKILCVDCHKEWIDYLQKMQEEA